MADQARHLRVGRHALRLLTPGSAQLIYDGDISAEDVRAMVRFFASSLNGSEVRVVVDLRGLGTVDPDARNELGINRLLGHNGCRQRIELGFVGGSLRSRLVMTVMVATARWNSTAELSSRTFRTWDEAVSWATACGD